MLEFLKKLAQRHISRQIQLTNTAENEKRELTAEEQSEFDELQRSIDAITDQIKKAETDEQRNAGTENTDNRSAVQPSVQITQQTTPNTGAEREYQAAEVTEINAICRNFGLDADEYFKRGMSIDDVRREAVDEAIKTKTPLGVRISVNETGEDAYRRDMADGMIMRGGVAIENTTDGAKGFAGMSLRDLAIDCLSRANGENENYRRMSADEIFGCVLREYYNPTAAFPAILDAAVQKSYINGWERNGATFDRWVKKGTLTDFKESKNSEYIMGFTGELEKVPENGELTAYSPKDAKMPKRKLETYGKQFTMTRQAFINDDIGMITTMPARYAEIAKLTQNRQCYDILMNNRKIHDGKTLFHADHNNVLSTGTGITLAGIQQMIYKLGKQKDLADNPILVKPDVLIVPLGYGIAAEVLLKSPTINYSDNTQAINPFAGRNWEIIEDVTMNYLVDESAAMPYFLGVKGRILQIDYLNGQEIPTIRRSEKPGTLGFVWDIFLDWGISDLGWQGIVKNPGVVLDL